MKKRGMVVLLLALCLGAICIGCGPKEEDQEQEVSIIEVELEDIVLEDIEAEITDWSGRWNTLAALANQKVEDEEGESVEVLRTAIASSLGEDWQQDQATELVGVVVESYSWMCYNQIQPADGSGAGSFQYNFVYDYQGAAAGQDGVLWHQFYTDSQTDYQYLILSDILGEEGEMRYFYFRYGDSGFNELLESQTWKPMFVSYDTTPEQLLAFFSE